MKMRVGLLLALGLFLASAAQAQEPGQEPANGVPFQPRHGWFAETQVGVFTSFLGETPYSNGEPWVAISFGFDVPSVPHLTLFFTTGHGSNAADCKSLDTRGNCSTWNLPDGSLAQAPEDFSVIPLELGVRYGFGEVVPRLTPYLTAVGGYAFMLPAPVKDAALGSPEAGIGGGIEYVTRLTGLTIGAELIVRSTFTPMVLSLAAYPRIKYVF